MADTRSGKDGTNVHGLFGAIIVEAAGATWSDPVAGGPLDSGLFADIYYPAKETFREYAVFFHDELEIVTWDGQPPVAPHTGLPNGTTAISYRSGSLRWDVESGMWGTFRLLDRGIRYRCETACRHLRQWWEKQWYEQ